VPEVLPPVFANPVQLRQMVENLLENASKYTHPGGIVTVHATLEDQQIILRFIDNGIGIPQVDLPFIFDKFYRASNANNEMSGTGLGLSIVRSIVEAHQAASGWNRSPTRAAPSPWSFRSSRNSRRNKKSTSEGPGGPSDVLLMQASAGGGEGKPGGDFRQRRRQR